MSKQKDPTTVRELTPHAANPRNISDKRLAQLGKSMARFGDLSSITVNRRTGKIVSGHQRVRNLLPNAKIETKPTTDDTGTVALGRIISGKNVWPYRVVDVDDKTEKAMLIAANAAGGDFDDLKLGKLVRELDSKGMDLELLNLVNLDKILAEHEQPSAEEDEVAPIGGKTISKRGDVWVLGAHRVMCGDATSDADLARLMGHDRAAIYFSDPPYGVSYAAKSGEHEVIAGDHKRDDDLYTLVVGALKQAVAYTVERSAFYVFHASSTRREFDDAIRDAGLVEKQYLIWVKNALVMGRADYHWAHEPFYYACKAGVTPAWHGDRAQPTVWRATLKTKGAQATTLGQALVLSDGAGGGVALVPHLPKGKKSRTVRLARGEVLRVETASAGADVWEVDRDHEQYIHPTQKPVALSAQALRNSTKPGDIVLDTFGGSGSTLMGAEATGRAARLMEMSPAFVDGIVRRWQDATGQKAIQERA